jgi:hypothetical protein
MIRPCLQYARSLLTDQDRLKKFVRKLANASGQAAYVGKDLRVKPITNCFVQISNTLRLEACLLTAVMASNEADLI